MSYSTETPQGPGWLLFFQTGRGGLVSDAEADSKRIMKDDNEILEIVTMMVNCDVV